MPALIESIKVAGLVLITDVSYSTTPTRPNLISIPKGVDGMLIDNAILKFMDTVE